MYTDLASIRNKLKNGMPKKRRKKALPPRVKRMDRSARLQSARSWLKTYNGRNIASGYRKHFGVDWVCAFRELEMLGVKVDSGYKSELLKCLEGHIADRQRRKARREETYEEPFDQDENFAYIAGYTAVAFAYGVTCSSHHVPRSASSRETQPSWHTPPTHTIAARPHRTN